jgi:hypothetical protein
MFMHKFEHRNILAVPGIFLLITVLKTGLITPISFKEGQTWKCFLSKLLVLSYMSCLLCFTPSISKSKAKMTAVTTLRWVCF